jgi:hypothetical protein
MQNFFLPIFHLFYEFHRNPKIDGILDAFYRDSSLSQFFVFQENYIIKKRSLELNFFLFPFHSLLLFIWVCE